MKNENTDSILKKLKTQVPILANATHIAALTGGLSNKNYRIDTPTGAFVVRVSDAATSVGINRKNEYLNMKKAYQTGICPAVIAFLPTENALVIDWIEGKTLHKEDFTIQPTLLPRIAHTLKKLHAGAKFHGDFNYSAIRKQYLKTVLEKGYFIPDGYLDKEPLILELEKRLAQNPEKRVPCHNDLVAANVIDDGKKIWIIDYEYASQNEASFDIGNFAAENGLNAAQLTAFCRAYWGENSISKVARARAWSIIARYTWILWASIQAATSSIDFDFNALGREKWASVLPELEGSRYQSVLDNLATN